MKRDHNTDNKVYSAIGINGGLIKNVLMINDIATNTAGYSYNAFLLSVSDPYVYLAELLYNSDTGNFALLR